MAIVAIALVLFLMTCCVDWNEESFESTQVEYQQEPDWICMHVFLYGCFMAKSCIGKLTAQQHSVCGKYSYYGCLWQKCKRENVQQPTRSNYGKYTQKNIHATTAASVATATSRNPI